jgi:hypothetical protein
MRLIKMPTRHKMPTRWEKAVTASEKRGSLRTGTSDPRLEGWTIPSRRRGVAKPDECEEEGLHRQFERVRDWGREEVYSPSTGRDLSMPGQV